MFKNALFTKTVCLTTIYAFAFAIMPRPAPAQTRLAPISFSEMYRQAENGEVEALRAAVHRGLNIDILDSNGDTGLCIAAKRRDVYTYNAFRASGANPRHPCTQRIYGYADFVERSDVVGMNDTSRTAYAAMGDKETYRISPAWWWVGGALAAGGLLYLLLGHKHGGKKSHSSSDDGDKTEDYFSLGANIATKGKALKKTSGNSENTKLLRQSNDNVEQIVKIDLRKKALSNTDYMNAILYAHKGGSYINAADTLLDTGVGTAAMTALKESSITNYGYIKIDSYNASVGMVASEGSSAYNYGKGIYKKDSVENIELEDADTNSNGISMNFSGFAENNTIVGMYADTKSSIENHGDIQGTAIEASKNPLEEENQEGASTSGLSDGNLGQTTGETEEGVQATANTGALIGMEAMILNVGTTLNQDVIKMLNGSEGIINLVAGDNGDAENQIKVSLVGMGSFLDNAFLNGSHIISRAENVEINNEGTINLSYTGNYTSSSSTALRKGLGGIVGIRSDANTNAYNSGDINIILHDEFQDEGIDVSAGMQSVHGGNITNSGNIRIATPTENKRVNYGMLAVEGSGANSSLYANINPNVDNSGSINIQLSNSFGMASFVGGTVHNSGNITLGSVETRFYDNIAMYGFGDTQKTDLKNTGTIDIYTHKSIAMQNDYAGGTDIINEGIVNIHESAMDSYVFGGSYSRIYNDNTINYDATSSKQDNPSYNGEKFNPFRNYDVSVGTSIISSKARSIKTDKVDFSSSATEGIYNNKNAVINMNGSSFVAAMAVEKNDNSESTQAKAYNYGNIEIKDRKTQNATNSVGMYMDEYALNNAGIFNQGTIKTNSRFSAAMASESVKNSDVINRGKIETDSEYSLGIYVSDYSNIHNYGKININDKNSVAVQIGKNGEESGESSKLIYPEITNEANATITVGSERKPVENSFGIYVGANSVQSGSIAAKIINNGVIDLYTTAAGAAIYSSSANAEITNSNLIDVYGDNAFGIYNNGSADIVNKSGAIINVGRKNAKVKNSYAIYNTGDGSISNKGTINLYNEKEGYAIYSSGNAKITNEGKINLFEENSTAVYASHGSFINKKSINILNDGSLLAEIAGDANMVNDVDAVINIGSEEKPVRNSNGIVSTANATGTITNKGTINLYNGGNSHAAAVGGKSTFINDSQGVINSYNGNTDVILGTGEVHIYNNNKINIWGDSVTAIRGDGGGSILSADNNGTITIGEVGAESAYGSGIFAGKVDKVNNNGRILIYGNNGHGIYVNSSTDDENSGITNSGDIEITGTDGIGMYGGSASSVVNNGIIELSGENSKAIQTNVLDSEKQQTVSNNNALTLRDGNNSYGIYSRGAVDITNGTDGRIVVGSEYDEVAFHGYGIYAQEANSILNNSQINVYAKSAGGIFGGNSIKNNGKIYVTGDESTGIYGSSINTLIENTANIIIDNARNSNGIYSTGQTTVTNNNENSYILIGSIQDSDASNANGIFATSALSVTNGADITVYANSAKGIAGGIDITNNGYIYIVGENSKGIYGSTNNTGITNTESIMISEAQGSAGIYSEGTTNIRNTGKDKTITVGCNCEDISAVDAYGIYGIKSTDILNHSDISVYGKSSVGIAGGIKITNTGDIYVSGGESIGISAPEENTSIDNSGSIIIPRGYNSSGIFTNGQTTVSSAEGSSIIIGVEDETPAFNVRGIYAPNSVSLTNSSRITIYGDASTAITGHDNIVNNGPIFMPNGTSNKGISADGNSSVLNKGLINILGASGSYGIYTTGTSTIDNQANIILGDYETTASTAHGIYAQNAEQITNDGIIEIYAASSTGIYAGNASTIDNNKDIHITQDRPTGIFSEGSTLITNNATIRLDNAANAYGIRSTGQQAQIVNDTAGGIILGNAQNPASYTGYGIHAVNASDIDNYADIEVYASDGYGIYAESIDTITNHSGKILVSEYGAHGIYTEKGDTSVELSGGSIELPSASNSFGIQIVEGKGSVNMDNSSIVIGSESGTGGSGNYGIYLEQGEIESSGSITIYGNGMGIEGNNNTTVSAKNITVTGSGTAINRATSVTIVENGNVSVGSGDAIIANGAVTNNGNITVADGRGITTIGEVTNVAAGVIDVNGAAVVNSVSLQNSGKITGNTASGAIYNVDSVSNLTKDSSIINNIGYGIYKPNAGPLTVVNEGLIQTAGTAIYNNKGTLNVTNTGIIRVTGNGNGIDNHGPANITNEGVISVLGTGDGIHLFVPDYRTSVSVVNSGIISVTNGYAIFIRKDYSFTPIYDDDGNITGYDPSGDQVQVPDDAHIECTGTICYIPDSNRSRSLRNMVVTDNEVDSSLISTDSPELLKNVKIVNLGVIKTAGAVDFGSADSENKAQVSIGDGGSYEADSFSGEISADASIVEGGFETTYVNENSFVGENDGIEVVSESYMFDADTKENEESGNTDVVMTMKPLEEVVEDDEISEYLEQNYQEERGEGVFNTLKTAQNKEQFNEYLHKQLGFGMLPNLAKQSLDIERTVAANVNDELLNINNESTRFVMNTLAYQNDVKSKGKTSGYKDKVVSVHGFGDKATASGLRLGLGAQVVRSDSDFDDKSSRYNNMAEIFAPIIFHKDNLSFMSKPKAGFARGHYRRTAVDNTHKANTKEYYYGVDNIVRQNIDLNLLEIEPDAEFNITGLYTDDIKESAGGLKIKDKNIMSAQSVLGVTAKKKFEINSKSSIGLAVNAKYFHEFGKKYKNRATVGDMVGYYDIISNRLKRDFGLIGLKAQYDYQQFTLDASANLPLEEKRNPYYMLNVKYKF